MLALPWPVKRVFIQGGSVCVSLSLFAVGSKLPGWSSSCLCVPLCAFVVVSCCCGCGGGPCVVVCRCCCPFSGTRVLPAPVWWAGPPCFCLLLLLLLLLLPVVALVVLRIVPWLHPTDAVPPPPLVVLFVRCPCPVPVSWPLCHVFVGGVCMCLYLGRQMRDTVVHQGPHAHTYGHSSIRTWKHPHTHTHTHTHFSVSAVTWMCSSSHW